MSQQEVLVRKHFVFTGTPGTGKTTLCKAVVEQMKCDQLYYLNVGDFCKQVGICSSKDEQRDAFILDEDDIVEAVQQLMEQNEGKHFLLDYHGSDFWPEDWIAGVFVVQTDNGVLYERLQQRQYTDEKIQENVQCEIFRVLLEEAQESFDEDIVIPLINDTHEQLEQNVETVANYIRKIVANN